MSAHQRASRGASGWAMPKVSRLSYQRSDQPSGSSDSISRVKVKNFSALKDSGITTMIGAIRNTNTPVQIAR